MVCAECECHVFYQNIFSTKKNSHANTMDISDNVLESCVKYTCVHRLNFWQKETRMLNKLKGCSTDGALVFQNEAEI